MKSIRNLIDKLRIRRAFRLLSKDSGHSSNDVHISSSELIIPGRRHFFFHNPTFPKSPVLMCLHGGTQSMEDWLTNKNMFDFVYKAFMAGFSIMLVDSVYPKNSRIKSWDAENTDPNTSVDLPYFRAIFSWINQQSYLNPSVNIAGVSSGAFMGSLLSCLNGTNEIRINKFICHSGGWFGRHVQSVSESNLKPSFKNIPVTVGSNHPTTIFVHGVKDNVVPFQEAITYYYGLTNNGMAAIFLTDKKIGHTWSVSNNKNLVKYLQL